MMPVPALACRRLAPLLLAALLLAGCAPETDRDPAATACGELGDWRTKPVEVRLQVLQEMAGLDEEQALEANRYLEYGADTLEGTRELAAMLAELTDRDPQALLERDACRDAMATLDEELCLLAVRGPVSDEDRDRLSERSIDVQEKCLLD